MRFSLRSAELFQLTHQQLVVAHVEFHQSSQVGCAIDIDMLAVQPQQTVSIVGQRHCHLDLDLRAAQLKGQLVVGTR